MSVSNGNLLITGAAGMLGSAFANSFRSTDLTILTPTSRELDLRDRNATINYLRDNSVTDVLHCAARVGGIAANIEFPLDYILENLLIDSSIIDSSVKCSVKKFLYIGSSCMYPKDHNEPITEDHILTGKLEPTNEGYALAKLSAAHAVIAASVQNKVDWKVIIPSNLYGPGDSMDISKSHLIASIILKLLDAKVNSLSEVEIWGDGTTKREFTYIDDVAEFVASNWKLLSSWPSLMNLGIGVDLTVREYYEMVAEVTGYKGKFSYNKNRPTGMKRKLIDSSVARQFGWDPQTSYLEGIKKTVLWYQEHYEVMK
jgi:GDP-L-fucose synthase